MTVVRVDKDSEALTVTVVAEFDAPIERVWQLWADPRQLERWWGPPGYPATFEQHDFVPGGRAAFSIGDASRGWWEFVAIDPPRSLELVDGWADEDGAPIADAPTTRIRAQLAELDGGTRMEIRSLFASREHLQQILDLGALEAFEQAVGQMDALLAS